MAIGFPAGRAVGRGGGDLFGFRTRPTPPNTYLARLIRSCSVKLLYQIARVAPRFLARAWGFLARRNCEKRRRELAPIFFCFLKIKFTVSKARLTVIIAESMRVQYLDLCCTLLEAAEVQYTRESVYLFVPSVSADLSANQTSAH